MRPGMGRQAGGIMDHPTTHNLAHHTQRVDMAAAFRWTAKLNMHEAVANHFSLAVSEDGKQFLINPNQRHFSLIKASDLLHLDADDPDTLNRPNAPDPTAWGLHAAMHRDVPHARCVMHVHSIFSTVLASLADSRLPAVDQNSAMFFNRVVVDAHYGGLAFADEGARCAAQLTDPLKRVMIMGNHGILVLGSDVADTFNRMYYFERAAETYIRALQTGQALRYLSDDVAESVAAEMDVYPDQANRFLADIKQMLDHTDPNYRD
jgi:ribulose-5-phosphate 4-epimerase/fuculose-1-phosphate aldolase